MAYRIQYGNALIKEEIRDNPKRSKGKFFPLLIVVLMILISFAYTRKDSLEKILIPGNPAVTKAAAKTFLYEIRSGERLEDAFRTFCLEIIDHAAVF